MNKYFITPEIYQELVKSLKSNFKIKQVIRQPENFNNNSKVLIHNNFYFLQNELSFFGITSIKENHSFKNLISCSDQNILFLLLFTKIDLVYHSFKNNETFMIKHKDAEFSIDFSKKEQSVTKKGISVDYSDNTISIYSDSIKLFASFYSDELFCTISKKEQNAKILQMPNFKVLDKKVQ